jgi:hypothetical protein
VRINNLSYRSLAFVVSLLAFGLFSSANAQSNVDAQASVMPAGQVTKPTVMLPSQSGAPFVAGSTNLLCGGFIQYAPAPNNLQIVGSEEEQEQRAFSQGDVVYINTGARDGVREGQEFMVIRPRGQYDSKRSAKRGWLGVYTQELGVLRFFSATCCGLSPNAYLLMLVTNRSLIALQSQAENRPDALFWPAMDAR